MQPKFLFAAALCLADLAPAQALAQAWPDKPIAIIVPFPAGGSTDGVMRFIAPKLAERLGQPVVVENIGGAGGAIGANRVAHATADGSTLLAGSINDVVLQPRINPRLGYGSDSFEPIAMVSTSPLLLVARKDLPQENIDAVVEALKRAPGSLSFGSPGQGTFQHVVMEDLQRRTQTRMLHVPYRGAAPLINDLLGGQVDMAVMAPPTALPHLQQNRIRLLGVISASRLAGYPDLPTINESKSVQGMDMIGWTGLLAPRGVPAERVERLRAAIADVMRHADVRERMMVMGLDPVLASDPASFAQRIASDARRMQDLTSDLRATER